MDKLYSDPILNKRVVSVLGRNPFLTDTGATDDEIQKLYDAGVFGPPDTVGAWTDDRVIPELPAWLDKTRRIRSDLSELRESFRVKRYSNWVATISNILDMVDDAIEGMERKIKRDGSQGR